MRKELDLLDQSGVPRLVNIQEMARILGVNVNWLYQRTRLGSSAIPFIRVGRYVRFDPKAVLEFLAQAGKSEAGSVS